MTTDHLSLSTKFPFNEWVDKFSPEQIECSEGFGDRNFIKGTQHNGCDVIALHGDMNGIA